MCVIVEQVTVSSQDMGQKRHSIDQLTFSLCVCVSGPVCKPGVRVNVCIFFRVGLHWVRVLMSYLLEINENVRQKKKKSRNSQKTRSLQNCQSTW